MLRVPPAPAPYLFKVRLQDELATKREEMTRYSLHALEDDGVLAHSKVVVGAPDVNLLLGGSRVSDGKLCSKAVDVVEVAVALVLMLLLELDVVEHFVVEARFGASERHGLGFVGERAGSWLGTPISHLGKFLSLAGSLCASFCVGADTLGREYALTLVEVVHVGAIGNTGISFGSLCDLGGAESECRAHDGAFSGLFCEAGNGRESGGGGSREGAKGSRLGAAKERADTFEFCEGRKLVHR